MSAYLLFHDGDILWQQCIAKVSLLKELELATIEGTKDP